MVRKFRKRVSGLTKLKKLVYLISPYEINKNFYNNLNKVLAYGNVKFFSAKNLKKLKNANLTIIAKKIRQITINIK